MDLLKQYILPIAAIVGLIAARLQRHLHYNLLRGLSVCALCAACFAVGFVLAGWDKASVAFLFIFVPTATIVIGRWSVLRQYQLTLPPKDLTDKVQP